MAAVDDAHDAVLPGELRFFDDEIHVVAERGRRRPRLRLGHRAGERIADRQVLVEERRTAELCGREVLEQRANDRISGRPRRWRAASLTERRAGAGAEDRDQFAPRDRVRHRTTSNSPAAPMPPPTHIVTTTCVAPRRRPSMSACPTSRAPDMP